MTGFLQLEKNPYPENIKAKVLEELSRYEMLPASAGESGVIKSYIGISILFLFQLIKYGLSFFK